MSSLSRTSRLLLTARLAPVLPARAPASLRLKSSVAAPSDADPDSLQKTGVAEPDVRQPHPADHGTSAYSPVPSFPEDMPAEGPTAASILSGAPSELQARTVRIYKPAKAATQSGNWNSRQWRMDWDVLPRGHRWENPLMGWQSSGDFMQGTHIFFKTKEDAIHFAEKQGYDWFVQEPNERNFRVKSYAANFLHSPKKLKIVRTK